MLVTSILSFSHNVFYPIRDKPKHWVKLDLLSTNAFNLVSIKILLFDKESKDGKSKLLCFFIKAGMGLALVQCYWHLWNAITPFPVAKQTLEIYLFSQCEKHRKEMKCNYNSCTIKVCIPPYNSSEKRKSKCCQHCNRSTLIKYNGLKSQIKWQLSELCMV